MTRKYRRRTIAPLFAIALGCMAAVAAPTGSALAMQILDAADHAELSAEISATGVNRIALAGDRIARVVRAPDGFAVEHDAVSGDLYLRPLSPDAGMGGDPVTLFLGTERGFTYRLSLIPAYRDSAQILIRNADAAAAANGPVPSGGPRIGGSLSRPASREGGPRIGVRGRPHIAALVRLVRAVARRETLPGYAIARGEGASPDGLTLIETWRGPRLAALVFEAAHPASPDSRLGGRDRSRAGAGGDADGGADLAGTIGGLPGVGRLAALWLAAPGTGPAGGRLVVAVTEAVSAGELR